jgi:leucyl aminopeptidase
MSPDTLPRFAPSDADATPIHILPMEGFATWLEQQPAQTRAWVETCGFRAGLGEVLRVPGDQGQMAAVLLGWGQPAAHARGRFDVARALGALKTGTYRLEGPLAGDDLNEAALGWLLGRYAFDRYATQSPPIAQLVAPEGIDAPRIEAIAAGEFLTRNLINTPASDMGPDDLEQAVRGLASAFGAQVKATVGDDLLVANFPMIHAVGRASVRAPRLLEMTWGNTGPALTLVGKGVCFDTGGLNLKPGASMGLMKKDMGGAATVLGLAHMIMALNLPLRLQVLIPAVENAVAGNAFRPSDILSSRKGLSVEVNNTDAEGRLVLADALAFADETPPDLMICMATLTGAARVALGPDLAPFYTDDAAVAAALSSAGDRVRDPLWRMPLHRPYEASIEPKIADLDNAPSGGMAGSITAALFLDRFVTETDRFVHFDIYGWQPTAQPGRPKGGVGMGARAILEALPEILDL